MASETYFKNFNQIQYGNNAVVDITERVVTIANGEKNPYAYYPLELSEGYRADQVSSQTYRDPYASWILYLSNDIVDPYYEWPLNDYEFDQFIKSKYGSVENAMQKIAYWRNNWVDQNSLNVAAFFAEIYDNPQRIKYWQPDYNASGGVSSYSRVKEDWTVTTNKIVSYSVLFSPSSFIVGEVVDIVFNDPDDNRGTAQVVAISGNNLIVQHNLGVTIPGEGTAELQFFPETEFPLSTISGRESGVHGNITAVTTVRQNISDNEAAYWAPVYYYEMEMEKNAGNRTIRVLQPSLAPKYVKNVKELLSNT